MKTILALSTLILAANMFAAQSDLAGIPLKDINGKDASLKAYHGKVLLMVNVASKCGYTPQYKSLEATYRKYKDQGLAVLGFPCNQFGGQEPGSNEDIKEFCSSKYEVTFPLFDKLNVKGLYFIIVTIAAFSDDASENLALGSIGAAGVGTVIPVLVD